MGKRILAAVALLCATTSAGRAERHCRFSAAVQGLYLNGEVKTNGFVRGSAGLVSELDCAAVKLTISALENHFRFSAFQPTMQLKGTATGPSLAAGLSFRGFSALGERLNGWLYLAVEQAIGAGPLTLDEFIVRIADTAEVDLTRAAQTMARFTVTGWSHPALGIRLSARPRPWLGVGLALGYEQYHLRVQGKLSEKASYLLLATAGLQSEPFERWKLIIRSAVILPEAELGPWQGFRISLAGIILPTSDRTLIYGVSVGVARNFF